MLTEPLNPRRGALSMVMVCIIRCLTIVLLPFYILAAIVLLPFAILGVMFLVVCAGIRALWRYLKGEIHSKRRR